MRRRLIVLREAKSDWSTGVADHDRPLAARGRREAVLAGMWLRDHAADIGISAQRRGDGSTSSRPSSADPPIKPANTRRDTEQQRPAGDGR